jgi:hypothetical protein
MARRPCAFSVGAAVAGRLVTVMLLVVGALQATVVARRQHRALSDARMEKI